MDQKQQQSTLNSADDGIQIDSSQQLLQLIRPSPIHITSYLNTLHVRQITEIGFDAVKLNATIRIQPG